MSLQEELQGPPPAKLVVDHVSKWFRQNRQTVHALDDVSLEVAESLLHVVGLETCMEAYVHELSGGMKQRVALASALAPNPRVLLMDEPFAALDAMTREQLYGDIQRIWEKRRKTIIFVTHNVREAACLADRVMVMSPTPGRIREVFEVDLPRPRDFNSIEIAQHAAKLTTVLKGFAEQEVAAVS